MIHKSAQIDPKAELGRNVTVGANCYIGPDVVVGDDCVLHNNVTLTGHTRCGKDNVFYQNVVVGVAPQDLKYQGGDTFVELGDDNILRENVTVHAGTEIGSGVTKVGSHNRFLVGVHVAHDAVIGSDCILSNYVQLAGHVHLEDKVTIAGIVGIHHFTTVGTLAYIGGLTRIVADVPPYMIVEGNPSRVRGFNRTGMARWGLSEARINGVREAFRLLFSQRAEESGCPMLERLAKLEQRPDLNGEVRHLCESIRRSLHDGVFGRYLERLRQDTDSYREGFYGRKNGGEESQ